ncbi:MAG: GGDEF domain-containing protein [Methylobacter sp.]|nr:GGDEF domain-containing protein [Methylobacter sp.]MDP2427527.1 GGDEF domain-containing protein [Methylobacter sp.]MDP3056812.1 GGDEF domain-containing protein [Methylobacter sp.]MDP3364031.1 GGDEF domain-containing protein [Methylobacter sp.]MDZ4220894.1 GGDEF domain-containing protein [Methylobacter sp.]
MFPPTVQNIFSWTIQLSAQQDYQALTHNFLDILADIPWIDSANAYEMYEHERKKPGDTATVHELLIRRFPLDFARNDDENYNSLFAGLDHASDLHLSAVDESGSYTWAIFPIRGSSGPERAIHIEGAFNQKMLDLLNNLRAIYRNLVILHDTKERDVLTKLPNRQSLDVRLLQVCEHYRYIDNPEGESSWIAILDIDHFKQVNDDFGHLYGDEVLLTFSQLMGKCFRYNDFLFRFGGEEFVVILNLACRNTAMTIFNRFRESVANYHFPTVGRITVSIGLTRVDGVSMPTTQLDHADKALYYAKENGRNRVVLYEDMIIPAQNNIANDIELF